MTKRQIEILKAIVEAYIVEGEPIGSEHLLKVAKLKLSSATIRNEMHALEQAGMLEKSHVSSGRVPSTEGYVYYAHNLATTTDKDFARKLEDIFAKRRVAIDFTIDEAASAISELAGFTVSISSQHNDDMMASIQLTPINDSLGVIVIVTSSGSVESKTITFTNRVHVEDVRTAVKLFRDRLVNTRLSELATKALALAPILATTVKEYEDLIQAFARQVFDFNLKPRNKVYGNYNIIKSDISRESLAGLMVMLETKSVWEAIDDQSEDDKALKIAVRPENIAFISKRIQFKDELKEISVVGSRRLDYTKARQAILMLERLMSPEQR